MARRYETTRKRIPYRRLPIKSMKRKRKMEDKEIVNKIANKLAKENIMVKIPVRIMFKKKDKTNFPVQATKILSLNGLLKKAIRQAFKLRDSEKK